MQNLSTERTAEKQQLVGDIREEGGNPALAGF
jgi:hypothetical protein